MKKRDLKTLALMGLTGGLLVGQQGVGHAATSNSNFQETPWEAFDHGCKGKGGCGGLADHGCKGKGGCGNIADHGCKGKGGCGNLADKCHGKGGCGNIADKCHGKGGCGGIIADSDQPAATDQGYQSPEQKSGQKSNPNDGNMRYHLMTEEELLVELNEDGIRMYNSLDDQGKALARKVASMMCAKTNECKGLNGCMTDKNTCAGKGDCKGQGKCTISDKNLAVKLVYDKMAAKRKNMLNN